MSGALETEVVIGGRQDGTAIDTCCYAKLDSAEAYDLSGKDLGWKFPDRNWGVVSDCGGSGGVAEASTNTEPDSVCERLALSQIGVTSEGAG